MTPERSVAILKLVAGMMSFPVEVVYALWAKNRRVSKIRLISATILVESVFPTDEARGVSYFERRGCRGCRNCVRRGIRCGAWLTMTFVSGLLRHSFG